MKSIETQIDASPATTGLKQCECADSGCPVCRGKCSRPSFTILRRIDMDDVTGTAFCEGCADDAAECGLFFSMDEADDNLPAQSPESAVAGDGY